MAGRAFEDAVERATGLSVDELRAVPVDERREQLERERGAPLRFRSRFPFVGRGNVLRDRAVSHGKVEQDFRRAVHGT